jgi:cytochrome b
MQIVLIWDRYIRLFHWSIVAVFFLNHFITEDDLHDYLGYFLLGLLVARVVWGFCGSQHARFASFFPTPSGINHHIKQIKTKTVDPTEGHNPLGGLMILLLLILLFSVCITGWMMGLDQFWGIEWVETVHELLSNIILAAVLFHVAAVLVMSKLTGINLIKTMISGERKI